MSDPREIVAFDGDTCVHASAGTGKTSLLVAKFLKLLAGEKGGPIARMDEILAITFTEKAADEMRQRIGGEILKKIRETELAEHGPERTRLLSHLTGSRRRMSQAYISTIHSFCARVLRENPVEAGIDPMFEILDEQSSSALMSRSLGQFLLAKLRRGDHAVVDLAYRYGFSREGNFESSLSTIIASLFPLIRAADMDEAALLAEYSAFIPGAGETLSSALRAARSAAAAVAPAAKTEKAQRIIGEVNAGLHPLETALGKNREEAVRLADALARTVNLVSFRNNGDAKTLKTSFELIRDTTASFLAFRSAGQLAALIGEFRLYYTRTVKNRTLVDFDDLQELTLELFRRNARIRDEYRRLFRGILVDEFQDVNRLQKEIIYSLAAPGEGKLFIVGDPKQAIYGFRGGDVEVFSEAQKEITHSGGMLFTLAANYRSTPELVEFANVFFWEKGEGIFGGMDRCHASRPAAGEPAVERIAFPPMESADDSRFREARLVATRIAEMNRSGIPHRDIVVLFRKFTVLPLYEAAFRNAGVPTMVYRGAGFFQSQEVADMVSVLSFIEDPSDLVSWVAALRSPLAGCSDETVLALRRAPDARLLDPQTSPATDLLPEWMPDALEREKVTAFTEWVSTLRGMKDRITISEMIEAALEKSGFIGILGAQPNGLQKAGNVVKLIEMGRAMESAGTATLKNFIRRMTALIDSQSSEPQAMVASPGQDVVRITTIHQAKGLQFPVVFLVDIDGQAGKPPSPVLFDPQRGLAVKYVDKATLRSYAGTVYARLSARTAAKEREDSLRLFYVGCTRAQNRLALGGGRMRNNLGRADAVGAIMETYPALFRPETEEKRPLPPVRPARCAYDVLCGEPLEMSVSDFGPTAREPMRESDGGNVFITVRDYTSFVGCRRKYLLENLFTIRPEPRGAGTSADTGSAVHAILERLDFTASPEEFKKSLEAGVSARMAGYETAEKDIARKSILHLYATDLMETMRTGSARMTGREIPFIFKYGSGKRDFFMEGKIDLLLRTENGLPLVVDYKYSLAPKPVSAARMQAELYALAVARLTGSDGAACALAYLKGKPRLFEWELALEELDAMEGKVRSVSEEIIRFEEEHRGINAPPPMGDFRCPNRFCGLARFCL